MEDQGKSKDQLIRELRDSQQRIAELEASGTQHLQDEETIRELLQKIERAKQEWEATVDSLPDLACLVDHRGRIIRANRSVETWNLGRVLEVEGQGFHELLHPGCTTLACHVNALLELARENTDPRGVHQYEVYDDTLKRYVLVSVQPLRRDGDKEIASGAAVVMVRDITERKRAEEVLVKAERLAAIRQIVTTVCHEINNPLTAVLGYAQWLQAGGKPLPHEIRKALEQIETAAKRIKEVVRKLYEIEDRPVPYAGGTTMIDINGHKEGDKAAETEITSGYL